MIVTAGNSLDLSSSSVKILTQPGKVVQGSSPGSWTSFFPL